MDDLVRDLGRVPADIHGPVRNNGGGHSNHATFWTLMGNPTPMASGNPTGAIAAQITKDFGDFEAFKKTFNETDSQAVRIRLGMADHYRTAS